MNSRERVLTAINHKEADRVPFDLGGTAQSGMHWTTYVELRRFLGLSHVDVQIENVMTQTALLDEDIRECLLVDTVFLARRSTGAQVIRVRDDGDYTAYSDEWGISWRMPKQGGYYYDMYAHPFDVDDVQERLRAYPWPDPTATWRFAGLRERARAAHEAGKLVLLNGLCAGIVEMYSWLRGYERFYTDLAAEPDLAATFLNKLVELKAAFWLSALAEAGEYVDVVTETDDLASQQSLLMSPATYRRLVKPRQRELYAAIKKAAPHVKLYLHSCGAVRPLIPDLIEIGVDILNPIQLSATGMDAVELKHEFGQDLVFWGGGVDTQRILPFGTPQEIRDDLQRNIEALAPGGGFVFTPVHITQANVSPENWMAMWNAWREFSVYA